MDKIVYIIFHIILLIMLFTTMENINDIHDVSILRYRSWIEAPTSRIYDVTTEQRENENI